ncbi:putative transposase, partial [Bacteroides thetaiotaomicron]
DFCINEAYTESSFYYWKGKFGLSRRYHMDRHSSSLEEFAPVSLTSSPASHSACDSGAIQTGEIRIEFPGGIIAHFSGMAESQAAMQLLTQLCNRHVLPE